MLVYSLIGIAIVIVASLAFYAGRLLYLVKAQKEVHLEKIENHNNDIVKSVKIIAAATVQGQCDYSEACIRISVLMGRLQLSEAKRSLLVEKFKNIHALYEDIKHLDTHEQRKALSKKERHNQDVFRLMKEEEFQNGIEKELPVFENFDWKLL